MRIIHIASEFAPLAKVGGLGDVVHGLTKQEVLLGHDVEVILPKYDIINYKNLENFSLELGDLWSFEDASRYHNAVWTGFVGKVKVHLIEPHHNSYYFNRGKIYGATDDIERFVYFCRTACEFLHHYSQKPDIIHLHDWPTASLAVMIKHIYRDLGFSYGSVILTIHNVEHQGKCAPANLSRIGLRGEDFRTEERMQDPHDPSALNLLKGGIVYSDAFTTVSPSYAKEIMTPSYSFGLDSVIRKFETKFYGILNGIETDGWNPQTDPYIPFCYPPNGSFIESVLKNKEANKQNLFQKLHLKASSGPLIACISRLVHQKGPKLIAEAIHYTLKQGGSFVLLGSFVDPEYEKEFLALQMKYKDHPHFYMKLELDEPLAHHLFAAADAIIVPSLFEPCGLTQMIGMRYAAIPIVRKTGGLGDTVFDIDHPKIPLYERNGFTFENPDPSSLEKVLKRALRTYDSDKKRWRQLMQNALSHDFSWKRSALAYERLYSHTLDKHQLPHAI